MKKTKTFGIIVGVLCCAALVGIGVVRVLRREGTVPNSEGRYYVQCDDDAFQVGLTNHMYMPGYNVPLIFSVKKTDQFYTFDVEGVDEFTADYYEGTGYLIVFLMPENGVKVTYEAHDLNGEILTEPDGEIGFVMDENPSTGYEWEYEVSDEDVIEIMTDQYVNDPVDPDNPTTGGGGTHFFRFRTIGSGTVDIHFTLSRAGDDIDEITYRYQCDGTNAVRIE